MIENKLNILAVTGSLRAQSVTRTAVLHVSDLLESLDGSVDVVDFTVEPLPPFNPETSFGSEEYKSLRRRVMKADVLLLGNPDYHGSISSTLKNFLDHFWKELAGKLVATLVASHEKGLTATDQLRTVARQCYAWTLPYGVSIMEKTDVSDGEVISESARDRLLMMAHDISRYGRLLADQRIRDLDGSTPGFLATHRSK